MMTYLHVDTYEGWCHRDAKYRNAGLCRLTIIIFSWLTFIVRERLNVSYVCADYLCRLTRIFLRRRCRRLENKAWIWYTRTNGSPTKSLVKGTALSAYIKRTLRLSLYDLPYGSLSRIGRQIIWPNGFIIAYPKRDIFWDLSSKR